jgi:hypothetical protein
LITIWEKLSLLKGENDVNGGNCINHFAFCG